MKLIIKAENMRLEYSGRNILDIDELELYSYDRIGLVGENGAGKTTLLKILTGELPLSGCKVQSFGEISYIKQVDEIQSTEVEDYAVLSRLGVLNLNPNTMSGGEETRTKIASAFSHQTHAIFADEPTCHLDCNGIDLITRQIKNFAGAILIISHDRNFLDNTVDKIWELKNGKIAEYWGGYSDYLLLKENERQQQILHFEQLSKERRRLECAAEETRKQASQIANKQNHAKAKNSNENAGRLGHQKSTGRKQKKMYQAAKKYRKASRCSK